MRSLILFREYLPEQTLGRFIVVEGAFKRPLYDCAALELPYLDNKRNISCIPEGVYPCRKMNSRKYGHIFSVNKVPGRDLIRIHAGNYLTNTRGCILPGREHLYMDSDNLYDVNYSADSLDDLYKLMPKEFQLYVIGQ